jgi:hypothetical protein
MTWGSYFTMQENVPFDYNGFESGIRAQGSVPDRAERGQESVAFSLM